MIVMVCGSRSIEDYQIVVDAIERSCFDITKIIAGAARGVDKLAIKYTIEVGIPYEEYPANWEKYGKSAGYKRNIEMIEKADKVIAIWDGISKGTNHSIKQAKRRGKEVFLVTVCKEGTFYEWNTK